ncbi:MAG: ATP-dependent DNA helicase, partial [Acidimicrobiales bacterium]
MSPPTDNPDSTAGGGSVVLTSQQFDAVTFDPAPLRIVAGAGAGKTLVMVERIAHFVASGLATPSQVLGLTFTNKAAAELKHRVDGRLGAGADVLVTTYHGFGAGLVADHLLELDLHPRTRLLNRAEAWQLLFGVFDEFRFDKRRVFRPGLVVNDALVLASHCADHLVEVEAVEADARVMVADGRWKGSREAAQSRLELCQIVAAYQREKRRLHLIDFDDQIRLAVALLAAQPALASALAGERPVVLLDEYQDTNVAQRVLLQQIYGPDAVITAVGDDMQSIYAFRGAHLRNLVDFGRHFPPMTEKALTENRRSGDRIVQLANRIQGQVTEALRKDLTTRAEAPVATVECFLAADDAEEAAGIAAEIRDLGPPWSQRAVLCRKRRLIPAIADALEEASVPVEVIGSSGLLDRPEVVDLVAWLELLADGSSSVALLRILEGPSYRIGQRDLAALARHATRRGGGARGRRGAANVGGEFVAAGSGGVARGAGAGANAGVATGAGRGARQLSFDDMLEQAPDADSAPASAMTGRAEEADGSGRQQAGRPDDSVSMPFVLIDAIEDLAAVDALSPKARAHLEHFRSQWDYLGAAARRLPLVDLAELVAERVGLWGAVGERGRDNLLRFLELAQGFQPVEGVPGLVAFLDYLRLLDESEEDLAVSHAGNRDAAVVLTIHQAKGLEWDCVWIPGLAGSGRSRIFPDERGGDNPLSKPTALPWWLCDEDPGFGDWRTATRDVIDRAVRLRAREEEWRLLYVACTRARWHLVCSAAQWYPGPSTPQGPSEFYKFVAGQPDLVTERFRHEPPDLDPQVRQMRARRARFSVPPSPPPLPAGATTGALEQQSLFHEQFRPLRPVAPATVSVTELVSFRRCPRQFYWLSVNPLPRRPSPAAALGSQVHRWIELQAAGQSGLPGLIEPDAASTDLADLDVVVGDIASVDVPAGVAGEIQDHGGGAAATPGGRTSGASVTSADLFHPLAGYQAAFHATPYAALAPRRVEAPFVLARGGRVVRGRIDAMY